MIELYHDLSDWVVGFAESDWAVLVLALNSFTEAIFFPVPPDLLQHLSPLGWQHINLTGDYLWTDPDAPSTALRPLRQMRAVEGTAKP